MLITMDGGTDKVLVGHYLEALKKFYVVQLY
jgi:hypothetical protein